MNNQSSEKKNIKLVIEYDGTAYHGWQSQNNAVSVQDELTRAISKIVQHPIILIGAGRTDAGVHAIGQAANFFTSCTIPVEKIPYALNSVLAEDIVVKEARIVSEDFNARYSAKGKRYRYILNNSIFPSALERKREYFCQYNLDASLMNEALQLLCGEHDFKGFMATGSSVKNTVRNIYETSLVKDGKRIFIDIHGNGFLYNMVRIIVGTLIEVGRRRLSVSGVREILKDGDRSKAGKTVPPYGLYLVEVYY